MSRGETSKSQIRTLAKKVLDQSEYVVFQNALKRFTRTKSVGTLCSDLVGILSTREKGDLLVEVRQLLPKHLRSEFSQQCRYHLLVTLKRRPDQIPAELKKIELKNSTEELHTRLVRKLPSQKQGGKRRLGIIIDEDTENKVSNQHGSPSKMARLKDKTKENSHFNATSDDNGFSRAQNQRKKSNLVPSNTANKGAESTIEKDAKNSGRTAYRTVTLERSQDQDFGFQMRSDISSSGSGILIIKVFKNSPAHRQGIRVGDQIICVNDFHCGRTPKDEVIKLIKTATTLHLRVLPTPTSVKVEREGQTSCVTTATDEARAREWDGVEEITVKSDGDGWLGCSIRGGCDYACDVHIISVKEGSPAMKAGLRKGDTIIKVNNASTKTLTHIQVVRLIVTATLPVTFTIRPGKPRSWPHLPDNHRIVSFEGVSGIPTTPLRLLRTVNDNTTPSGSPAYPHVQLPGYSPQFHGSSCCYHGNIESPSHLPLHAINLNQTPPPPYTVELPSEHRLLARAEDEFVGVASPWQQDQPSLPSVHSLPPAPVLPHSPLPSPHSSLLSSLPLPPFPSPLPPPPSPWLLSPLPLPDPPLLPSHPPPLSSSLTSPLPSDSITNTVAHEESNKATGKGTPDGRQCLLSEIRGFNKAALRGVSEGPSADDMEQAPSSGTLQGNWRDHKRTEPPKKTGSAGRQRNSDDLNLLSVLNQALENRARVLNMTFDESEESDSEWDL